MSTPAHVYGNTELFSPLKLGNIELKHRVIMAPLTRVRSPAGIPTERVARYYEDRATPGGLLISEATHISVLGGSYNSAPGIFTPEQIRAWKKVTAAVHAKGGFIYCQLWHVGRTTHPVLLGGRQPHAPSAVKLSGVVFMTGDPNNMPEYVEPKEMTHEDIKDTIEDYVHAAKSAIAAGFDGVEVHNANGYLLDQFLCDNINLRTDEFGGSIENRARFPLQVLDAVVAAIGPERVGIRYSPFGTFQETNTSDIQETYGYAIAEASNRKIAYIHLVEPRDNLIGTADEKISQTIAKLKARGIPESEIKDYVSLKPFRKLIQNNVPLITCGGFDATNALDPLTEKYADGVVYGRWFISNPDLVERLRKGHELAKYDRSTFYYVPNPDTGYNDYPAYAVPSEKL